jgi:uncharacterized protein YdaU (DUF1376 family)
MSKKIEKNHWIPFYYFDYERDTECLSIVEHGAYLLLLKHCWKTEGPLPLDEMAIFRIAGAIAPQEQEIIRKILTTFFVKKSDGFYNKKALKIIDDRKQKRAKLTELGRKGGLANAKANAKANAMPNAVANALARSDTHTEIEIVEINEVSRSARDPKFVDFSHKALQHIASLNMPNLMNFTGLDKWLAFQAETISKERPDLTLDHLMQCWVDTCHAGQAKEDGKGVSSINYFKKTFLSKAKELQSGGQAQPAPQAQPAKPKYIHTNGRLIQFLEAKAIKNRFTGEVLRNGQYYEVEGRRDMLFYKVKIEATTGAYEREEIMYLGEWDIVEA